MRKLYTGVPQHIAQKDQGLQSLRRVEGLNETTSRYAVPNGALIGLAITTVLAILALAFAELTNTRASVRPFMIIAMLLSAWMGGRTGGLVATAFALVFSFAYSTEGSLGEFSREDVWFFVAFVAAAIIINVFAAERQRREHDLRAAGEELVEAARTRQELLESVQESEARYRSLADAMPQLVWTADQDGNVDYFNARASVFDGIKQLPGGKFSWEELVHPDDLERTTEAWSQALAQQTPLNIELRLRMKDGEYRWHVSRGVPVTQDDGSVRWYGTATDVEALHGALAAKDEFLALVSHDLRSPLTTIMGYAGLLRRGVLKRNEDIETALLDIESKSRQLNDTILELVELARVREGTEVEFEPVNLEWVIDDVIKELKEITAFQIEVRIVTPHLIAMGNQAYTRRIVRNLISNAIKYGENSLIEVDVTERDDMVEVRVSDRGIGISDANIELLFAPFFRAEDASEVQSYGLGIGLTLCKRLVEAQQGVIGAAARQGGGSTFWFTIHSQPLRSTQA